MNNGSGPRLEKIVAEKISFGYTSNDFLFKKLDFNINRGEITGLIGPTGSGKSSLGQMISSLLKPSEGHIKYLDNHGRELAPDKIIGKVTGVFQQPERQFFLSTCEKEITFGPSNFGRQLSEEEIKSLFELVGLDPERFADRDPFTLSMGEKRRLAFASVVSLSPGFIVFDEPTCGLDIEGVGRFVYMAETLKKAGLGLVIISHDGSLIKKLADWIFYLPGDLSCHIQSKDTFFDGGQHLGVLSSIEENSID